MSGAARRALGRLAACLAAAGWATVVALGPAAAASAPARPAPLSIRNEVLTMTRGPGTSLKVFQEITLSDKPKTAWTVPLPHGAYQIAPSSHVRLSHGRLTAPAGTTLAAVVYSLPGRLGSVFVQDIALSVGKVTVLAAPGVYPGVGTGLTLHGEARIAGKEFTVFAGGSQGPGGVVHFSLTLGNPGRIWADGLGLAIVLWLAAGAYLASRRLLGVLRDPGQRPDAA